MKYVYLDNFRGFKNCTIPIYDVNFLVGENSTGKTSLLTMMRTLQFPPAYMGLISAGEEVPAFGHFNEMVSAHASDRSYFRIGVVGTKKKNKKRPAQPTLSGILLTYSNVGGLPKISQITCTSEKQEVSLRLTGTDILYKTKAVASNSTEELPTLLQRWAKEHCESSSSSWSPLKNLPRQSQDGQIPLFLLLGLASQQKPSKDGGFPIIFPDTGPPLVWIAPIRSEPRRTYDEPNTPFSPKGSHIPYIIKRILSSEKEATQFKQFMESVGQASGLFQKIEIKHFGGASETSPFEVDAYLDGKALSLAWLGYGVSQSLPILVELLDRPKGSWFAVQQPEVHLHPRAQSSLGDVFFEMAVRDNKTFLVETHSDFTIDRFRMNYRAGKTKKKTPKSQILFFERHKGHNVVTSLPIGTRGEMPSDQPDGYRDFFIKEEMRLLGL